MERTALESKVSKGLAALRDDAPAEPEVQAEDTAEETPEVESNVDGDETPDPDPSGGEQPEATDGGEQDGAEDGSEEEDSETPEQPQAKPKAEQKPKAKTGPTLPDAVRRSLQAYGWDDDAIDAGLKADPTSFTVAASKIHATRNAELARWAELGRTQQQAAKSEQETAAAKVASARTATEAQHLDDAGLFKPVDVDALIEKHGNEDIVRAVAEPVNAIISTINSLLPDLRTGVASINESRQQTMTKQIDEFFGGKGMETFLDLYGKDSASLSDEQLKTRNKVLDLADAMILGARAQGQKLTTAEALKLAHDSVSSGHKAAAIRKEVKGKVTQRGKSLSLRPSAKGGNARDGAPKNRSELEAATASRLANVFGR